MGHLLKEIEANFSDQDDFFIKEEQVNKTTIYLIGFKTLIDLNKSKLYVKQMAASSPSVKELVTNLSDKTNVDRDQIINSILEGKLVICLKNPQQNAIVDPIAHELRSSIEDPKNESPIQAAMDAFGEDIHINVGMIRKRLNSDRLCHYSYQIGDLEKRKISMLYIKGKASNSLTKNVDKQLNQIKSDIEGIDSLNRHFGKRRFNPVSHFFPTELPTQAVHSLKKNRIILFVDNLPFALTFPHLFWDMLTSANDRNFPFILTFMLRIFRVIGVIATLILPALYVALVSVNPEVFRTDIALFTAESREGIPLSAFLETIVMVVIVDLILEAITRLPKSVGPTVTMVGGIILGQAMVEAKLVSNLLVIVITAVVIASSTVVGMQNSLYIRLLKYPILILASIFGILGLCAGLVFTIIYLASLTSNNLPYITFSLDQKEV
ncbi:spore germination protein [Virgibacillus salexigens]|uniref:spore germination protein n=1 Tax=Virgibacillus salexigens TaxID=61016 RepID=UPI00190BE9C1|nr:spore germination protein [Virgibacillus salexigens]